MILHPIELTELPDRTRDWLLCASAAQGCSPTDVVIGLMDQRARRDGFIPDCRPLEDRLEDLARHHGLSSPQAALA